jgi:hypothetical protein
MDPDHNMLLISDLGGSGSTTLLALLSNADNRERKVTRNPAKKGAITVPYTVTIIMSQVQYGLGLRCEYMTEIIVTRGDTDFYR